jgi:hypothetical protein
MVVLLLVEVLAEQGEKEMTAESLFWWVVEERRNNHAY